MYVSWCRTACGSHVEDLEVIPVGMDHSADLSFSSNYSIEFTSLLFNVEGRSGKGFLEKFDTSRLSRS